MTRDPTRRGTGGWGRGLIPSSFPVGGLARAPIGSPMRSAQGSTEEQGTVMGRGLRKHGQRHHAVSNPSRRTVPGSSQPTREPKRRSSATRCHPDLLHIVCRQLGLSPDGVASLFRHAAELGLRLGRGSGESAMRGNDWVADLVRDMWSFLGEADLPHLQAAALARGMGSLDLGSGDVAGAIARTDLCRPMLRLVEAGVTTTPCH